MNRLSVTIVDVVGLLAPGLVFLFGCMLIPLDTKWLQPLSDALLEHLPLLSNAWVAGGCWLAAAYVLGFLIRLASIRLMNLLTWKIWSPQLQSQSEALEAIFESALANPELVKSLKVLAALSGKRDPGRYAPYFHLCEANSPWEARILDGGRAS